MAVRQLLASTAIVVGLTLAAAASASSAIDLREPAGSSSRVQLTGGKGIAIVHSEDGTAYGRVAEGRIKVVDPLRGKDTKISLSGCEERRHPAPRTTVCIGESLGFTVQYGVWTVTLRGRGINSSAVARGWLKLKGTRALLDRRRRFEALAAHHAHLQARLRPPPTDLPQSDQPMVESGRQHILVVEDEANIASFVAMYLQKAGFDVGVAANGAEALEKAGAEPPSLIVLDLMLPDLDGIDVCRRIRARSDVPILMLTARDDDVDKIIGLEVGADDYLTKPFNPRELVARVKSILRRSTARRTLLEGGALEHGTLRIDSGRREVTVGGEEIQLAPKEFDLLWELLDHRGLVLTRDQLLERVWGYTFAGDTRTVDVHVGQLRRKLGEACPIVTVWGVGYKVASEPKAAGAGRT
jgi:DNA-binding response OmpR family regulator